MVSLAPAFVVASRASTDAAVARNSQRPFRWRTIGVAAPGKIEISAGAVYRSGYCPLNFRQRCER